MVFEWDRDKNLKNIKKHGIDFEDACAVFSFPFLETEDVRRDYGEIRIKVIGVVKGVIIVVVYTDRDFRIRIISARRAHENERKIYDSYLYEEYSAYWEDRLGKNKISH